MAVEDLYGAPASRRDVMT